ncbi:MAG: sulfotransferase family 2 domain-containing protein [Microcoleaceae cyanobacterium]
MLINLSAKNPKPFIFIANTKTASTSIEDMLGKYCHIKISRCGSAGLKHMSYSGVKKNFKFIFRNNKFSIDRFYKFGVFRDPVDWTISWFNYRSREELSESKKTDKSKKYTGDISFDKFVDEVVQGKVITCQSKKFVDENSKNAMDFIIRYEYLEEDLANVIEMLNFPDELKLPHQNKSDNIRIEKKDLSTKTVAKLKNYFEDDYKFLDLLNN